MSGYFDKAGQPIALDAYLALLRDPATKVVKQETVGEKFVSTVWLGSDHRFGTEGPPIIFETMVFPADRGADNRWTEERCERYSNEADALAGHERVVAELKAAAS